MAEALDGSVFVVGPESVQNMRLAQTLRTFLGSKSISRYIELADMYANAAKSKEQPITIFIDLLGYDLVEATDMIGRVWHDYPVFIFVQYLDKDHYVRQEKDLPGEWADHFRVFFKLYKMADDAELEPLVRRAVQVATRASDHNLKAQSRSAGGLQDSDATSAGKTASLVKPSTFISYAHADWQGFVKGFVEHLEAASQKVWIDQHLLIGGDDWMDSIGEVLDTCKVLTLIMSPDSLTSRYVKMEYRYFLNHDKPVLPILYRPPEKLPFELAPIQYFDFSKGQTETVFAQLIGKIEKHLGA